jgi:hypothetical protein
MHVRLLRLTDAAVRSMRARTGKAGDALAVTRGDRTSGRDF